MYGNELSIEEIQIDSCRVQITLPANPTRLLVAAMGPPASWFTATAEQYEGIQPAAPRATGFQVSARVCNGWVHPVPYE